MLTVSDIKSAVDKIAPQYPIKKVHLFGSYASDIATAESDVDVLVEFETSPVGYMKICGFQEKLQRLLSVDVDVITVPVRKAFPEFAIGRTISLYEKPSKQ